MLPMWQKPKGPFMAPTYTIGGSNSSHTRQGGINLIIKLVSMVFVLLGKKFNKNRGNNIFKSVYPIRCLPSNGINRDFLIDFYDKFTFKIKVFSTPKVLFKP